MVKAFTAGRFWQDFDWLLFSAALFLSVVSLAEIYSATMNSQGGGDSYLIRQLAAVLVGLAALIIISAIDYHTIAEQIPWIYLGSIGVLAYTLVFGREHAGTKGWIQFGNVIGFQPAELIKVVVVVALARILSEFHSERYMTLPQIVKAALVFAVPVSLVMLQGDLGTALTFLPVLAFGLFVRGIRPRVLVSLILCLVMLMPLSWLLLKDYQKDRIITFLHPETDPQGKGYQIIQSKIAIGSGGFWGKGLFQGSQNRLGFLPTRHTDFIFSVVGEELGFLGVMLTLCSFGLILFRSIHSAQTARDSLGVFIIMGIVGIFFFHIVENVGMVIGFMPVTGVPLPFISYGGSSVLSAFLALGLVISVRRCRYVN
jgi:rod shape determining protein RodA